MKFQDLTDKEKVFLFCECAAKIESLLKLLPESGDNFHRRAIEVNVENLRGALERVILVDVQIDKKLLLERTIQIANEISAADLVRVLKQGST